VLAFTIHMTLLGEKGLRRLARVNHANAAHLADRLARVPGVEVLQKSFFNEFTIRVRKDGAELIEALAARGILGGVPVSRLLPEAGLDDLILVASTEVNTEDDRDAFARALEGIV
jgi:glycine dehydrogenase subunit 1